MRGWGGEKAVGGGMARGVAAGEPGRAAERQEVVKSSARLLNRDRNCRGGEGRRGEPKGAQAAAGGRPSEGFGGANPCTWTCFKCKETAHSSLVYRRSPLSTGPIPPADA